MKVTKVFDYKDEPNYTLFKIHMNRPTVTVNRPHPEGPTIVKQTWHCTTDRGLGPSITQFKLPANTSVPNFTKGKTKTMQEATRSKTAGVTLHTVGLPAQRVKRACGKDRWDDSFKWQLSKFSSVCDSCRSGF